jgi:CubicO group peptidase (beta-lactamase class C family)
MNRRYLLIGLVTCVGLVFAACAPISPVMPSAMTAPEAAVAGEVTWDATAEEQIASAMLAAPLAIAQDATIMGNPPKGETKPPLLREGSNGWVCYPDWPDSPGSTPSCNNPTWEAFWNAVTPENRPEVVKLGLSYMLMGGSEADTRDPKIMEPAPGEDWIRTPPHLMVVVPGDLNPADFSTDSASGLPYIMWEGTTFEHLMIPVEMTDFEEADAMIRSAMRAAPVTVSKDATIMDFPPGGQTEPVLLRQGTNGWVCYPDWPGMPNEDPECRDRVFDAWVNALGAGDAAPPPATAPGIGYMLQGGYAIDNHDPFASEPPPGEQPFVDPPHVMITVPGDLSPDDFTTDHKSGMPYIMFEGTPWEHLMIPVADSSAPVALSPEDKEGLAKIDAIMGRLNDGGLFEGVALVARDGQIIFSKGYGLADREQNIPNTPQTIFRVGETTMQFTAAAMLLLEQDGKLSVQDPICNYLDDCPETWKDITIHHLLSHTSGLPDDVSLTADLKIVQQGATPQELVAIFRDLPLVYKPGSQRIWGTSSFVLAGLIIERVSGQSYGDFVTQRLFEPLGMTNSGYGDPPQGLADGYMSANIEAPVVDITATYAYGACHSTAEDLFRWAEGLHNGQLLNAGEMEKMLTWHATTESGQGSGYGIVTSTLAGHKVAGIAGGGYGYASVLNRFLDDRVTMLLIGNRDIDGYDVANVFTVMDLMATQFFGAD